MTRVQRFGKPFEEWDGFGQRQHNVAALQPLNASEYIHGAAGSLVADGYADVSERWGDTPMTILRKGTFKLHWMATTLHTFVYLYDVAAADAATGQEFANQCVSHALAHKGGLPVGFQNGVAAIAVMVTPDVREDARAWAEGTPKRIFAGFGVPAVVDLLASAVYSFTGTMLVGGIYGPFLKGTIATHIAQPLGSQP